MLTTDLIVLVSQTVCRLGVDCAGPVPWSGLRGPCETWNLNSGADSARLAMVQNEKTSRRNHRPYDALMRSVEENT